ncbi:hypothetical protein J0A68_21800 [Algoriphagus sp. H41]|uniref:Uncharacterized protein n=1 Tax=Algoriphagus oliviformis TaxID=2811231 RepID=A0ABS3C918_9BACT|nr:hypothetical protein [Algoriphagus oliviformis]MBN7813605.1 hypothetical protein [Algoriphagus oliviformis]
MNQLPKLKDFQAPEGYFERLPDQILTREKGRKFSFPVPYAAAAAVLIGLGLAWQLGWFSPEPQLLSLDEEAQLYIDSQVWTAEDVLTLSDDPNALLDQIIAEEMPVSDDVWLENELTWF